MEKWAAFRRKYSLVPRSAVFSKGDDLFAAQCVWDKRELRLSFQIKYVTDPFFITVNFQLEVTESITLVRVNITIETTSSRADQYRTLFRTIYF